MYKIPKVQTSEFYATQCIESMQTYALKERDDITRRWEKSEQAKKKLKGTEIILNKRKDLEMQKIRYINRQAFAQLQKLQSKLPKTHKIPNIYQELLNTSTVSLKEYKESLRTISQIQDDIDILCSKYLPKIQYAKGHETLKFQFKKFLGKFNSYYSKNYKAFEKLQQAALFLNKLPTFKEIYTIAIAGFPNVGKSTLMKQITKSDVEIQNYPFTTKKLMFGYLYQNEEPLLQFIDTPGLLGRNKSNSIEQRAQIILQGYSQQIIFVIDITESCGYSLDSQLKLFKDTTKSQDNIVVYFSKTDLFEQDEKEEFQRVEKQLKKFKQFTDDSELKEFLLQQEEKTRKVDANKISKIKI